MDIRSMQYYLAVVREGTISGAAEVLHVAQPSLSRQMKDLEEELGISLFERGNRKITLTEEGMVLRRRAEEMVRLMQMTKKRSPRSKTISPVPCVSVPENLVPFTTVPVQQALSHRNIRIYAFRSPAEIHKI